MSVKRVRKDKRKKESEKMEKDLYEGREVYVDVSSVYGKWKRKRWGRGRVIKRYNGWYLIEIGEGESKYKIGSSEYDIEIEKPREMEEKEEEEE